MKIKDTERLLASHAKLVTAAQAMLREADDFHDRTGHGEPGACVACDAICEQREPLRAVLADAKQVREQIARPIS